MKKRIVCLTLALMMSAMQVVSVSASREDGTGLFLDVWKAADFLCALAHDLLSGPPVPVPGHSPEVLLEKPRLLADGGVLRMLSDLHGAEYSVWLV